MKVIIHRFFKTIILLFILWYVIAFVLFPLITLISESFFYESDSIGVIKRLWESKRVRDSFLATLLIGIITTIFVNIISVFQLLVLEYFDIKFAKFIKLCYFSPLVFSGISLTVGYSYLYSSNGLFTKALLMIFPNLEPTWFRGPFAILFVFTLTLTCYHILFVNTSFRSIDNSIIESSVNMGQSHIGTFFKVALPLVRPSIYASSILVFLLAINSFTVPHILGGNNFFMISTLIRSLYDIGSISMATTLSVLLGIIVFFIMMLFQNFEKNKMFFSMSKPSLPIKKIKINNKIIYIVASILAWILLLAFVLPPLIVVIYSFSDAKVIAQQQLPSITTIENYTNVLSDSNHVKPIINSFLLSAMSIPITLFVGGIIGYLSVRKNSIIVKIISRIITLPFFFPMLIFSLGLVIGYNQPNLFVFNRVLVGTNIILPIAYSIANIYIAFMMIRAAMLNMNVNVEEAALSLGANNFTVFRTIILPTLFPYIKNLSIIFFIELLTEFTASDMLYSVGNMPLGVAIRLIFISNSSFQLARLFVYIVIVLFISLISLLFLKNSQQRNSKKISK